MNQTVTCAHCLAKAPINACIRESAIEGDVYFCCAGCRSVYYLLTAGGFGEFYNQRKDYEAGPVEFISVPEELFIDNIKKNNGLWEVSFLITGIRCASCIWLVENFLGREKGIISIRVNYATHRGRISWDNSLISLAQIINKITAIGYCPLPDKGQSSKSLLEHERKDYFVRFALAAFFTMQLMMYTIAIYAGYFQGMDQAYRSLLKWINWILATPVVFFSGYPFLKNSLRSLKNRFLNMDVLIFLGSFSAYFYSVAAFFLEREIYFDTACMILTLILLGRLLETGARIKAMDELAKLASREIQYVRKLENFDPQKYSGELTTPELIHLNSVITGIYIEILPGDIIPVDGMVAYGESEVNEALVSGEHMPVLKSKGSDVFAGSSNINGKLIIHVTKAKGETLISQIARYVEEAQNQKAAIQSTADKVVKYFVPSIFLLAISSFIFRLVIRESMASALINAVSILVVACPCALGLATPLAILVFTMRVAKKGIVVKSGAILEKLNKIDFFCFDKTGTLTSGKLKVMSISSHLLPETEILRLAASLENNSRHLIALGIIAECRDTLYPVSSFQELPGLGVFGRINGEDLRAGNLKFMEKEKIKINESFRKTLLAIAEIGETSVCLAKDKEMIGILSLADTIKEESIPLLKNLGKKHPILVLSGDTHLSLNFFIKKAGIANLKGQGNLAPFEKAAIIKKLTAEGRKPVFIGDGINDAPSLTEAHLGIALGKGAEIALESSDAVLLQGKLNRLLDLLNTGEKTNKIIRENLFWAFSYNLITVPLAVIGWIHPVISAILMSFSSLLVVFNSMRIGRDQRKAPM